MDGESGEAVFVTYAVRLASELEAALVFQTYRTATPLEGVSLWPLEKRRAENGWFLEYLRVTDGKVDHVSCGFELRQISVSYAAPGRINAFHIHPKVPQNELWSVIHGQLLVWLVDCRAGSPTVGAKQKLILTGEEPSMVVISAGVAHGYKAGPDGATLLYAVDQQFNLEDPNEGRLPWNYFGADLWEEDRG
jgi:dTDP-4-dehydrorhamnose 3,5-epimerase